jgi:hypothetical protein
LRLNKIITIIKTPTWNFVGVILTIFFKFGADMVTHIVVQYFLIIIALLLATHGFYRLWKQKTIEPIKKQLAPNSPDHFVELNMEALKAHLAGWINYESYKNIINSVILYRPSFESKTPTLVKYILYFDVKYSQETESTRKILEEFFKRKLPIIEDEFKNVYKKTVPNNHIDKWYLTIEKPEGVNKEFSFVLFP